MLKKKKMKERRSVSGTGVLRRPTFYYFITFFNLKVGQNLIR